MGAFLLLLSLGRGEATAFYEMALRLPTYAPWRDQTFETAERLRLAKEAIRQEPTNALFRMALCELLPPGDPAREEELRRLSQLPDPSIKRWALWTLASDAFLKGETKEALSFLMRSPPDEENALLELERAFALLRLGRAEEAKKWTRRALMRPSLRVYKSPARLDMERAHPHFVGTPIHILALTTRLREIASLLLGAIKGDPFEAKRRAKEALRFSLLLARSEGVEAAPEMASQFAFQALNSLQEVAQGAGLREEELEKRKVSIGGAMARARPLPRPKWEERFLYLFTFGFGRGKVALLTRWVAWISLPALPSLLLGLLLAWLLGRKVRAGRSRFLLRASVTVALLASGTIAGMRACWNPLFLWAERKVALYHREWGRAKAQAVAESIEEALKWLTIEGRKRFS